MPNKIIRTATTAITINGKTRKGVAWAWGASLNYYITKEHGPSTSLIIFVYYVYGGYGERRICQADGRRTRCIMTALHTHTHTQNKYMDHNIPHQTHTHTWFKIVYNYGDIDIRMRVYMLDMRDMYLYVHTDAARRKEEIRRKEKNCRGERKRAIVNKDRSITNI